MSATLGKDLGERLVALLADDEGDAAPLLVSAGRQFPVKTTFLGAPGLPGDAVPQLLTAHRDIVSKQYGIPPCICRKQQDAHADSASARHSCNTYV